MILAATDHEADARKGQLGPGFSQPTQTRMSGKFDYERLRPTGRCVLNMVHFLHE
jgi:hypothetical protein